MFLTSAYNLSTIQEEIYVLHYISSRYLVKLYKLVALLNILFIELVLNNQNHFHFN